MRENWELSIREVLKHEGGFVDHPEDPGGATNYGITLKTYRNYNKNWYLTAEDLKNIPMFEVHDIYRTMYWNKVQGDDLPSGIDFLVFDFGVNAGTGRAAKMLQELVGAVSDGIIGRRTLRATQDVYLQDPARLVKGYSDRRAEYYQSLPHFPTFGRGWLRRTKESEDVALSLLD